MTVKEKRNHESGKKKISPQQRRLRLQRVVITVIGVVVILSMVLALMMNY